MVRMKMASSRCTSGRLLGCGRHLRSALFTSLFDVWRSVRTGATTCCTSRMNHRCAANRRRCIAAACDAAVDVLCAIAATTAFSISIMPNAIS